MCTPVCLSAFFSPMFVLKFTRFFFPLQQTFIFSRFTSMSIFFAVSFSFFCRFRFPLSFFFFFFSRLINSPSFAVKTYFCDFYFIRWITFVWLFTNIFPPTRERASMTWQTLCPWIGTRTHTHCLSTALTNFTLTHMAIRTHKDVYLSLLGHQTLRCREVKTRQI